MFGKLLKPKKALAEAANEKRKMTIGAGLVNNLKAAAIFAVLIAVAAILAAIAFQGAILSAIGAFPGALLIPAAVLAALFLGAILCAYSVVQTLIQGALTFVMAKYVFKGKGEFEEQYYLTSIFAVPITAVFLVFFLLAAAVLVPAFLISAVAGWILAGIIILKLLALSIYLGLYIGALAVQKAHGFKSIWPGIISIIIPSFILGMLGGAGGSSSR